jgi:ADP-heptose:LPS heptosyltransferase
LEGTKSFAPGKGYKRFLGEKNVLPLQEEMYYMSINRMLEFLGYKKSKRKPKLDYIESPDVFDRFDLEQENYLVMHVKASHALRSLPPERWNGIIKKVRE